MTDRTQATDQDNQLSLPQQGDHNVRQDPLNKATNLKKTLKKKTTQQRSAIRSHKEQPTLETA